MRYATMRGIVDLGNPAMSFDQMHLTAAGNRLVADRLADVVRDFSTRHSS